MANPFNVKMSWNIDPGVVLNGLSVATNNKFMRIALNAGAAPVKAAVIATAPKDRGDLSKSTRIRVRNYRNKQIWVAIVGAASKYKKPKRSKPKGNARLGKIEKYKTGKRKGETKYTRPAKYQHFVDQGRKGQRGQHYLPAALRQTKAQFNAKVNAKLKELIEGYWRGKK
jgi:hypothetical protein